MPYINTQTVSQSEHERAVTVQGMLIARGFRIQQVLFPHGVSFVDMLVDASGPVHELKGGAMYARIKDQEIWQAFFYGVRVRWIKPVQGWKPTPEEAPPEVFIPEKPRPVMRHQPMATRNHHGWMHRLMVWIFGADHAH